jgi:hypothetical protein
MDTASCWSAKINVDISVSRASNGGVCSALCWDSNEDFLEACVVVFIL